MKVSCLENMSGIVQVVERSEKALRSFLRDSAFIHLLGEAAVVHIEHVCTHRLYTEETSCMGFFAKPV